MRTGEEKAPCPFTQLPVSPPEDMIEPNLPGELVLMRERNENPQTAKAEKEATYRNPMEQTGIKCRKLESMHCSNISNLFVR